MIRFIYLTAIICSVFVIVGCFYKDGKSGFSNYNPLNPYTDLASSPSSNDINNFLNSIPKTSITFQIVLPSDNFENNSLDVKNINKNIITIDQANIPKNIKADTISNPAVTFSLKLFATVEYENQTTFLAQSSLNRNQILSYHKRVRVDDASLASATFEGIPVLTALGEVIIEGGSIQGFTEFQGAIDLASQTQNVIRVYPKSKKYPTIPKQQNEIIAEVLQEVASNPYLLQDAMPMLVNKLASNMGNINLQNNTVYSDALQVYKNLPRPMPAFLSNDYNISKDPSTNIVNAGIYIDLPKESKILRSKLYCYSNYLTHPVRDNKTSFIKVGLGKINSPTIVFIKKGESYNYEYGGESLIMAKLITEDDINNKNIYVSATSTAEALVLYDQRILSLPVASFTQIRRQLQDLPEFNELVQIINQQLLSDNPYKNIMEEGSEIWNKVNEVAQKLNLGEIKEKITGLASETSTLPSIRANSTNASYQDLVGVEDDKYRNQPIVVFYNKSYCYYDVYDGSVTLASDPILTLEKNDVLNELLSWPPASGRKEQQLNIGAGVFTFKFQKNLGLTLFDAFLTAFSSFVGYKIDKVEDLREIYKFSAGIFMDFVSDLLTDQPKSWQETYDTVKNFVTNKQRIAELLEILSKIGEYYVKKKLEDGWLKTATTFIAQKVFFWGNLAQGVSDIAASVYSSARSPSSFFISGEQTTEGWFGDTFKEFLKNANLISSNLQLFGNFTFNLSNGQQLVDKGFFTIVISSTSISLVQSDDNNVIFDILGEQNQNLGQIRVDITSRTIKNVYFNIDKGADGIITVNTLSTATIPFIGYNQNDEIGKVFRFAVRTDLIATGGEIIQPLQQVISNVTINNYVSDYKYFFGPNPNLSNIDATVTNYTLQQLMWYFFNEENRKVYPETYWQITVTK